MKIAIVIILLVIATVIFHFASPWYFTPIASNWDTIDHTVEITFWVTGTVFIAVNLFLAYSVIKFRHNKKNKAEYQPENKKLELILVVVTTIGVITMLAPGLFVWDDFINVPKDAKVVEAVGQQWQWTFRFPGKDGKLGKVSNTLVSDSNPFGLDPKDPKGQDDILIPSNELHLPLDQSIKVVLRSKDVLHDFTVPQFRVKMDLVPGTVTYIWFKTTKTGNFEILCEELCGLAHYAMRGHVVVEAKDQFEKWLNQQQTFAQSQQIAKGDPVHGQTLYMVCSACHGADGSGNKALNAPNIGIQNAWYLSRQIKYFKKGIRGSHKDDTYGQQMVPMAATLVDEKSINDVASYIASLQPAKVAHTIKGDPKKGFSYYVTCGTCHGKKGEGNSGLSAPRLAGQNDWYLKRQLLNFKHKVRGVKKSDLFGYQMQLMSRTLHDEKAIDDLIAYINTF